VLRPVHYEHALSQLKRLGNVREFVLIRFIVNIPMLMRYSFLLLLLGVVGCQVLRPASDEHRLADKHQYLQGDSRVYHDGGSLQLSILVPDGWETFNTDAGIVLNEQVGSATLDQPLSGLLVHIFVPNISKFAFPESSDVNLAWAILKQVVSNPDYIGNAVVSDPVGFKWGQYDAAYYLLSNRDQTVTMLLALGMPERDNLVVCHVSVPDTQADRIRAVLPDLLSSLMIDGKLVNAAALRDLPDPLIFPEIVDG